MGENVEIRYNGFRTAPTLKAFNEGREFIKGLAGPFGSGKSTACVWAIVRHGMLQPQSPRDGVRRSRYAVCRNTFPQLRDTTIKTFHQQLPVHLFGRWREQAKEYTIWMTAPDGTKCEIEVLFRALDSEDDVGNLLSLELTAAWMNEAREMPIAIMKALIGRVGRFPSMALGGPVYPHIMMDTNQPDEDHWWYDYFEVQELKEGTRKLYRQPPAILVEANPDGSLEMLGVNPDAENLINLRPGYYEDMFEANKADPNWIKVYMLNQYGFVMDGKAVYPEYSDNIHFNGEIDWDERCVIYRGWDFGLTPAVGFVQVLPEGNVEIFDELVSEDMGIDEFSDDVLEHCAREYPDAEFIDYGDPAGEQRGSMVKRDEEAKTCFAILHSKGIAIEEGIQDPRVRKESVKKCLRTLANGRPKVQIGPKARTIRKAFMGGYQYKRKMGQDGKYHDKPDKNMYSHVIEATEYVFTRIIGEGMVSSATNKHMGPAELPYNDNGVI